MRVKYPRTYHLPFSPGVSSDDKVQRDLSALAGKVVIATEKMDGENCNMTRDHIWARSLDTDSHESRDYIKSIWGNIKHEIPDGWRICGENLYAKHSIKYTNLRSYLNVFSIWNEKNECLSWSETLEWCSLLNLAAVKTLWMGVFDLDELKKLAATLDLTKQEGFVIRPIDGFVFDDFSKLVLKFVREEHVKTDQHWMQQKIEKNELGG